MEQKNIECVESIIEWIKQHEKVLDLLDQNPMQTPITYKDFTALTSLLSSAKLVMSAEGLPKEKSGMRGYAIGYNQYRKEITPLWAKKCAEVEELKKINEKNFKCFMENVKLEQQLKELRERATLEKILPIIGEGLSLDGATYIGSLFTLKFIAQKLVEHIKGGEYL